MHCAWMTRNKLTVKSVVLLHEYMHRNVYDTHQLHVIDDVQLMTESVIDHALLQAMSHMLIELSDVMKFCLLYSLPHF